MAKESKYIIPKEVADSLKLIKLTTPEHEYDAELIRTRAEEGPGTMYGKVWEWIEDNGLKAYFEIIVNGYGVEKTPHDILREMYAAYNEEDYTDREVVESFDSGVMIGVRRTLNILGITVEGINDKDSDKAEEAGERHDE